MNKGTLKGENALMAGEKVLVREELGKESLTGQRFWGRKSFRAEIFRGKLCRAEALGRESSVMLRFWGRKKFRDNFLGGKTKFFLWWEKFFLGRSFFGRIIFRGKGFGE